MYLPILPKHVWQGIPVGKVGDFVNKPPVVGTGPYQVVEWTNGQSARLVRNEKYWGEKGAADEIVFQFFPDATNAMVDAFKNGELDYIRNPTGLQFDQLKTLPNVVAINAAGNGFTQINFNCYDKDIPDGGASTKALRDPAFRAALGYAIDRDALITRVLNGYGTPGTTQVPAWQRAWHTEPNNVRQFDLTVAAQKLEEAGYPLRDGVRYDKENKPIKLSLQFPDSDASYPKDAQFIADWFGQIGIGVTPRSVDSGTLGTTEYLDTEIPLKGQLKYDMVIWGWVGDPDPNSLLQILTTEAISDSSDSQWSNPHVRPAVHAAERGADGRSCASGLMDQMQQLFYDQAPYQMLYYDDELHVYRTDQVLELADPAGQRRHAVLRQRLDQLHHAQAGVGGLAVAVGRGERVRQRRGERGARTQHRRDAGPVRGRQRRRRQQRLDPAHPRDRPGPARDRGGRRPGPPPPGGRGRRRVAAVVRAP